VSTEQKFILTNAVASSGDNPTTQTQTPPAAASSASTYRLIANPTALSPHVGKKVELTGVVEQSSASSSDPSGTASAANAPALRVEAGKVLTAPCSQ
jgi:hypothetical protein